jgi:tRNA-2-methylthio-N6-dimethylallyladenosine synthase
MLAGEGYVTTYDLELADVIFLNTCSVREKAEQKVYSFIGRLRSLKKINPKLKIIVAGCVAQQQGRKLLARFEHLDLVLGTRAIPSVGVLLQKSLETGKRVAYLPDEESSPGGLFRPSELLPSQVIAPVTIMKGCNNFCTYCIVPHVRGREQSRPSNDVVEEVRMFCENGAREILLLGQNVNSYGRGLKEEITFSELIRRILTETNILRLRFTTSHPKDLTDDLMKSFAELPRLCKWLHLPFQSGSDRILHLMNRNYTAADYLSKVARLREHCPEIGLTADVMVGFPGETEEDFHHTLDLIRQVEFDNLFSFRYSDRPHAKSSEYKDKVPADIIARRLSELQSLQAEITLSKNRKEIGKIREILVEGPSKAAEGQFTGRTQQNRIVNFMGPEDLIGSLVPVKVTAAHQHSLEGEVVQQGSDLK